MEELMPQENIMKNAITVIAVIALCLGAQAAFAQAPTPPQKPAPAPDITGTWNGKTEVPDAGTLEMQLVIKKDKDAYSGTILDSMNMITVGTEIKVVELKDDALTLTFPLADGALITCRLKVAGDKMTGQWEHPQGATGTLDFTRKK
jgi:hypothetical protein